MLNRVTVSALLKAVILTTAFCIVIGVSLSAWDSWGRLQLTNRIAVVAEASANLFKAMNNVRADRPNSFRLLNADQPVDSEIDNWLAIRQIAWLLRNTAGEASSMVSNWVAAGRIAPGAHLAYVKLLGGTDIAWNALQLTASGMQLPPKLSDAIAANKTAYFEPQFLALRDRLVAALMAGEKPELAANQWIPLTVGRLGAAVSVAEAALDAARAHTALQHSQALRNLTLQLILLALALALTFGAMTAVSRRVIKPLNNMRDAMLKVASGDLAVDA